jgi:7-cyano-7-deazaguanine synthase
MIHDYSEKMKTVVLLSGGMDSVTCLYHVADSRKIMGTISFDYGSKHNAREIPYATYHSEKLGIPHLVIPLDFIGKYWRSSLVSGDLEIPEGHYEDLTMKQTVVPFRNGIMLSIATGYAESVGADLLVIAAHAGDHAIYPDCREDFMRSIGDAMRIGTYAQIGLLRPFIGITKADICKKGEELGVDYSRTWSCYRGGEMHCGKCGTCVERREAFILSGVLDPTLYEYRGELPHKTHKMQPELL